MLDTVPFTCLYNVVFVPKGARKPRERYFCKADLRISLNRAERSDARVAFRLHSWKELDNRSESEEVLLWENQLWWPLEWAENRPVHVTELGLLEALVHCRDDVLRQQRFRPNEARPSTTRIETVPMRDLIDTDFESAFVSSQRKAAAYLLLRDGMAYVAGGEPFYFIDEWGRQGIFPAGPDRAADPHEEWAQSSVLETIGRYRSLSGPQVAIFRGDFFPFDTPLGTIWKKLPPDSPRRALPVIEILIPAAVKTPLARIHLDALYRRLVHDAKYAGNGIYSSIATISDPVSADLRDRVLRSVRRSWDNPALLSNRLALLEEALRLRVGRQQLLEGIEYLLLRSDLSDEVKTPFDPRTRRPSTRWARRLWPKKIRAGQNHFKQEPRGLLSPERRKP